MTSSKTPVSLGTNEWPTCLCCGRLCLSDGTCLSRVCMQKRLDEARHMAAWQVGVLSSVHNSLR